MNAPDAGNGDRQKTPTELEMERGAQQSRYWANPGAHRPQPKPDPAAKIGTQTKNTTGGAGLFIVPYQPTAPAAVFAGLPIESLVEGITLFPKKTRTKPIESLAEGIKRETAPAERPPAPKVVPEGAVPVTATATITANNSEEQWNKSGLRHARTGDMEADVAAVTAKEPNASKVAVQGRNSLVKPVSI